MPQPAKHRSHITIACAGEEKRFEVLKFEGVPRMPGLHCFGFKFEQV
jgi:hypothetical protein